MTIAICRAVLKSRGAELRKYPNVVATGIGYKITGGKRTATLAIICSVERKLPKSLLKPSEIVAETIDGVPTDVVETGVIRALAAIPKETPTGRFRPAPGGVSIGHKDITAGTLGCLVQKNGETFILSNNHVLANSNAGVIGDSILQPGPYDGGKPETDTIAVLESFVPVVFLTPEPPSDCKTASGVIKLFNLACRAIGSRTRYRAVRPQAGENLVDAALARPLVPTDVLDNILGIGMVMGTAPGTLGMAIQKSGRTTGVTTGTITQVNVTVQVQYGPGQIAVFADQLMAGAMSQGGDSGSAVLDQDKRLVGLLFAGSETTTIMNRAENVLTVLGATR